MKKILVIILFLTLSACAGKKPSNQTLNDKTTKNRATSEEKITTNISYEEIITKFNEANTAKKRNVRTKEIIKEYLYNVGDDISRNEARERALNQVKILILQETGVFVESYLGFDSYITDESTRRYVHEEIKNLTAGIIKTKILDEKYDGKTFYIKASVLVDPDSVSEGITEILKIRANQKELSNLQTLLKSKESELDIRSKQTIELQKKLSAQELVNVAKENQLQSLTRQIDALNAKLNKYQMEENKLQSELKNIQEKIDQAVRRIDKQTSAAYLIRKDMTKKEVVDALGKPAGASTNSGGDCMKDINQGQCTTWQYGKVHISFSGGGVVSSVR
jgi:outer membrane murein-binding lipoprotein Lpp